MNTIEKTHSTAWALRTMNWAERVLPDSQYGFRRNRSTIDAVFVILSLIQHALNNHEQLIIVLVDFKKAFDTIDRKTLWTKIKMLGVSDKVLQVFEKCFSEIHGCLKNNDGSLSETVKFLRGVKQGDPCSPVFFTLMLHDLEQSLKDIQGYRMGLATILTVLFADDTTIVATSIADAQKQLDAMKEYAKK